MAGNILREVSSADFVAKLHAVLNFDGDAREQEYLDPGVDITGFDLPIDNEFIPLETEFRVKKAKWYSLTGVARITNPILEVPQLLLSAIRQQKGNSHLDDNTNQDIAVAYEVFGTALHRVQPYDPSSIIHHAARLGAKTIYSDAINGLAYNLAMMEMNSATSIVGRVSAQKLKLQNKYLSNLEFIDNIRVFNMKLKGTHVRGWSPAKDKYTDTWGRWYSVFRFNGKILRFFKGVTLSIVSMGNSIMVGSKDVIDHVYTLISSMFNWHYVEGLSNTKLGSVMRSFREDVFMTRPYSSMVDICKTLEPMTNSLADLQGDCGYLSVKESLSEFAHHLGVSLEDLILTLAHSRDRPLEMKTERYHWLFDLTRLSVSDMMRFGQLYKPGMYAIVSVKKGLKKLAKRVTRRFTDDIEPTFELIAFCTMSLCKKWTTDLGHSALPNLIATNPTAIPRLDQIVSDFSLLGKDVFWKSYYEVDKWYDIHPWKVVDVDQAPPLTDYIRDKRVHTSDVNFSRISKEDEIEHVLCRCDSNKLPDLHELLDWLKNKHEDESRAEFEYDVDWMEFSKRAKQLIDEKREFLTEGNPKEREQKVEARFFATSTFKTKKQLGYANELARRVAELLPGNAMVISDENRRQVIETFGISTSSTQSRKSVKIHVDISGHNQSFTTSPTKYWFEFIGNCLGIPNYKYLVYVFNNLFFHYKLPFMKAHYWHTGQNGGIEGWCGYAWGAHTGAVAELFLYQNGYKGSGAAYGDDVLVDMEVPEAPNYNYIETTISDHFAQFNQEVKISQTSITRSRATLTRKTYVLGSVTSSDLKKLMTTYQVVDAHVQSDLSSISAISSSVASALSDSNDYWLCVYLKWLLSTPIACGTWYAAIREQADLDMPIMVVKAVRKLVTVKTKKVSMSSFLPLGRAVLIGDLILTREIDQFTLIEIVKVENKFGDLVFHGDLNSTEVARLVFDESVGRRVVALLATVADMFAYMVAPQQLGGLGVLIWANSVVTGVSDMRAEVLELLNRQCKGFMMQKLLGAVGDRNLTYSDIVAHRYAIRPLVMSHSDVINQQLREKMESIVTNSAIKEYLELSRDRDYLLIVIVTCMSRAFSQRVAQKLLDCSDIAILDQILAKVSSAGAIMRLLDHPEDLLRRLNSLGKQNLIRLTKVNRVEQMDSVKNWIDMLKRHQFEGKVVFIDPHEPGMQHFANHMTLSMQVSVKKISPFLLNGAQRPSFRHQEIKPKYAKLSVMDMAVNDIVFRKVLELARFIVWFEADQKLIGNNVSMLGEILLTRLSAWKLDELRPMIPKPLGGELFHRIDNHGFRSGVMLRTMPRYTGSVIVNFLPDFIMQSNGVDSNVNYGYLDAALRFATLLSVTDLNVPNTPAVIGYKAAGFSLTMDVSEMNIAYRSAKPTLKELRLLTSTDKNEITPTIRAYLSWISTTPSYEDVQSLSRMGVVKEVISQNKFTIASQVISYASRCTDLPIYRLKDHVLRSIMNVLRVSAEMQLEVIDVLRNDDRIMLSSATMKHKDLRDELTSKLFAKKWPLTVIPNVFSAEGKSIITAMIVSYAMVFVKCNLHPCDDCLTVDWPKTVAKSSILRRYIQHLRIEDDEQDMMFWISSEGVAHLAHKLQASGEIPACLCRVGPSKAQLGAVLDHRVTRQYTFEQDRHLRAKMSAIETKAMLEKVFKGTVVLKRTHEVAGKYLDETNHHVLTLRLLQSLIHDELSVFDATAGIGRVNVACKYLGMKVVSATVDDTWLRRGMISNDVIVDAKYNYCDSSTWPLRSTLMNVHYVDTHILYGGSAKPGDLIIPDTVIFMVLKISEQVLEKLEELVQDLELRFPYQYMIALMPTSRRNFLILSKVQMPAMRQANQLIRCQLRYLKRHPSTEPYDADDAMSPLEQESVVMDMFEEIQANLDGKEPNALAKHDPWDSALYTQFVATWLEGKQDHESLEEYATRSLRPKSNLPSKCRHAMKVLLESGIDLNHLTSGDFFIDRSKNEQAIAWIVRSMACANGLSPAQYFVLRVMPAFRHSLFTWTFLALIRKWYDPVKRVYDELGVQFRQTNYVLKKYTRDLNQKHVRLDKTPPYFLSPKHVKSEKAVVTVGKHKEQLGTLADALISAVIFSASKSDQKHLMKNLLGQHGDLEPTAETEHSDDVYLNEDGGVDVANMDVTKLDLGGFDTIMNFEYDSDQTVESEYFADERLMEGEFGMSEADFFKCL
uniref:RNA-directed RNA polymerase n=1 Tax=Nees' Pellia aspi-like virus TaxID=2933181 RepID=A0A9C7LLY0_9VIRU|nr:RNA-dependent RNA polymerase [Nees' Pellia aspi-like virus]CAI5383926.1 RNA-dependent RNA polymerase [Nees' Pellia aspi-like virus]